MNNYLYKELNNKKLEIYKLKAEIKKRDKRINKAIEYLLNKIIEDNVELIVVDILRGKYD